MIRKYDSKTKKKKKKLDNYKFKQKAKFDILKC